MPYTQNKELLNNATSGASTVLTSQGAKNYTVVVTAEGVTTGATVYLQGTADGTNWYDIASTSISANGTTDLNVTNECHSTLRVNIPASGYTDGSYYVNVLTTTG